MKLTIRDDFLHNPRLMFERSGFMCFLEKKGQTQGRVDSGSWVKSTGDFLTLSHDYVVFKEEKKREK